MRIKGVQGWMVDRLAIYARKLNWPEAALTAIISTGSHERLDELGIVEDDIAASLTSLTADGWSSPQGHVIALLMIAEARL